MASPIVAFYMLGVVALLADMVYEGGRSVLGPYLSFLQASAVVAGVVSLGDVISYLARGLSGLLSRSMGARGQWGLLFLGYGLNVSVPLLALAGSPEVALLLVFLERMGKGLRGPVKDSLIASLTEGTRIRGVAYGVHEVLDQTGAILGPIIVAYSLASYERAFGVLALPFVASMALLLAVLILSRSSMARGETTQGHIPWTYVFATSMPLAGFMNWALIGYLFAESLGPRNVALGYSVAMVVDVVLALPVSLLFLRIRTKYLAIVPLLTGLSTLMALNGLFLATAILWGAATVHYETVIKRGLADRVVHGSRAYAFGIHGLMQGVFYTIGNVVMALLMEQLGVLVFFVASVQLLSLSLIVRLETGEDLRGTIHGGAAGI